MATLRDCASFVSGLGAGVALAVLVTPRSGSEVRKGIREKVQRGTQVLKDGKTAAESALERELEGIEAAVDAGKRAYRDTSGRGQRDAVRAPAG